MPMVRGGLCTKTRGELVHEKSDQSQVRIRSKDLWTLGLDFDLICHTCLFLIKPHIRQRRIRVFGLRTRRAVRTFFNNDRDCRTGTSRFNNLSLIPFVRGLFLFGDSRATRVASETCRHFSLCFILKRTLDAENEATPAAQRRNGDSSFAPCASNLIAYERVVLPRSQRRRRVRGIHHLTGTQTEKIRSRHLWRQRRRRQRRSLPAWRPSPPRK